MQENIAILKFQYEQVISSRLVLFEYGDTIQPKDFEAELPHFGRGGSIRNLLVHIANTYEFWIGKGVLQYDLPFTAFKDVRDMRDVKIIFDNVDRMIYSFFDFIIQNGEPTIPVEINGKSRDVQFVKLFTHVITHEFHHKGQILSLSRQLGYIPVDTDIMR